MRTYAGRVVDDRILMDVLIAKPDDGNAESRALFRALIDTGAMRTSITRKAANAAGALSTDVEKVYTGSGVAYQNVYTIQMHIFEKNFPDLRVFEIAPSPSGKYEILLGMDVIKEGVLHIEGGHFTFCI